MDTSELCMQIKATPNFCWCDGIWTANGSTTTALKSELQHFFYVVHMCPERVGPPRSG